MTLEEAIKHAEEVAEENQRVVDTKDVTIDMLFCDDEEIEERLTNYKRCAEEHKQLAEWLKDYKRLLEQQPCEDAVSRTEITDELNRLGRNAFKDDTDYDNFFAFLDSLPSVTPTRKKGKWIPCRANEECPLRESEE